MGPLPSNSPLPGWAERDVQHATRCAAQVAEELIAPETFVQKETGHSAERAVVELWDDSCRVVFAVTQGPRGGVFTTGKEHERLQRWEAVPVAGVDSCGAGDTFHGAYAWAVARGLSPAECFAAASWSAGLKVSRLGNEGIPTLEQLENARASSGVGRPV
jgi:sugar/nucleoside kinase (ribokinase family)